MKGKRFEIDGHDVVVKVRTWCRNFNGYWVTVDGGPKQYVNCLFPEEAAEYAVKRHKQAAEKAGK